MKVFPKDRNEAAKLLGGFPQIFEVSMDNGDIILVKGRAEDFRDQWISGAKVIEVESVRQDFSRTVRVFLNVDRVSLFSHTHSALEMLPEEDKTAVDLHTISKNPNLVLS